MQKLVRNRLAVWLVIMMVAFVSVGICSEAAGERVYFGSETYEWVLGEESPVGIYAGAEQGIDTVEMYVQYDAQMLEYVSGGELVETGLVRISVSGAGAEEYKEMLNFVPRMSGETQITIKDSHIRTVTGEESDAAIAIASAPVKIPLEEGCELSGIAVNGQIVSGFSPEKTSYVLEVEGNVENAEVTTEPSDVQTEISDTVLAEGENIIYVIATNTSGQKARYTLAITRKEQITPGRETGEGEQKIQKEPSVIVKGDAKSSGRNQMLIMVLLVMLLVILAMLIVIKIQIIRKNKHRRKRKKRNAVKQYSVDDFILDENADCVEEYTAEEFLNSELEISVRNVTMEFKREKDEATSIKELLIRTLKKERSYEMFKALDDVSFEVRKGEVVGVIGTNGSGKSTILKIISGVLAPTKGEVLVDKNKIQLLTLGTGFDYELTGRENVYLNGAVIGYTKEYIDEKYDDIVKFAELDGFMEEKVRNYSSGMVSRLGFAIATVRDTPEILILDEVLSVGDMFFRQKSEARIREMMHGGSTVLIVSHSTSVIRNNCTKAVWIEKGKLRMVGEPKEVCTAYEKMNENAK